MQNQDKPLRCCEAVNTNLFVNNVCDNQRCCAGPLAKPWEKDLQICPAVPSFTKLQCFARPISPATNSLVSLCHSLRDTSNEGVQKLALNLCWTESLGDLWFWLTEAVSFCGNFESWWPLQNCEALHGSSIFSQATPQRWSGCLAATLGLVWQRVGFPQRFQGQTKTHGSQICSQEVLARPDDVFCVNFFQKSSGTGSHGSTFVVCSWGSNRVSPHPENGSKDPSSKWFLRNQWNSNDESWMNPEWILRIPKTFDPCRWNSTARHLKRGVTSVEKWVADTAPGKPPRLCRSANNLLRVDRMCSLCVLSYLSFSLQMQFWIFCLGLLVIKYPGNPVNLSVTRLRAYCQQSFGKSIFG